MCVRSIHRIKKKTILFGSKKKEESWKSLQEKSLKENDFSIRSVMKGTRSVKSRTEFSVEESLRKDYGIDSFILVRQSQTEL